MPGALAIVSFALVFVSLQVLLSRFGRFALDRPNARSLHDTPVPRTGGIAVLLGVLVSWPFAWTDLSLALSLALALAGLSFIDDVRGVPAAMRLACHLFAAAAVVAYLLTPMGWIALALLAIGVAWMTNVFNFMDGSDGLAGGMALIGFSVFAIAADSAGHAPLL